MSVCRSRLPGLSSRWRQAAGIATEDKKAPARSVLLQSPMNRKRTILPGNIPERFPQKDFQVQRTLVGIQKSPEFPALDSTVSGAETAFEVGRPRTRRAERSNADLDEVVYFGAIEFLHECSSNNPGEPYTAKETTGFPKGARRSRTGDPCLGRSRAT